MKTKSLLTALPVLAMALLLTACVKPAQPAVPESSPSVERALEEALAAQYAEDADGTELIEADAAVEVDGALEALEAELNAAVEGLTDGGSTEIEISVETETTTEVETAAPEEAPTPTGLSLEEEILQQQEADAAAAAAVPEPIEPEVDAAGQIDEDASAADQSDEEPLDEPAPEE